MPEPVALTPENYACLRTLLRQRLGHDLGDDKQYLVTSRLIDVAEAAGLGSLTALFERLRVGAPGLERSVLEAMVTGETRFFRTPSAFAALAKAALPALIAARASTRALRIWSAACSTGQEPYSIAMLLDDEFPELFGWDVSILATDYSEPALARARAGIYTDAEIERGLPEGFRAAHLRPFGDPGRWSIAAPLRRRIVFASGNLIEPSPFEDTFDVVFLRNVLIYFDTAVKRRVLDGVRRALREDGYLFLGEAETTLGLTERFRVSEDGRGFYRPT